MIKSLKINKALEDYIAHHSYKLNPIQKEIINHNERMGSQKKMQISVTQGYFFQFFICIHKAKRPPLKQSFYDKTVEREGFEPSILLNTVYPLSRRAPSAARPPLQNNI